MKLLILLSILTSSAFCQDSLITKIRNSDFSGDTIINYIDNINLQRELPTPKGINDKVVEIVDYKLSSEEKLLQSVFEIFSENEIRELIESNCIIKFVCLSDGQILSASFGFVNKEPNVPQIKLICFSDKIKKEFTLNTEFKEEIITEGYIKCSYGLFLELKKFK